MPPDGRMYNATGRKGELHELRTALNATDQRERRTAVKRVVAAMTLGRDVSSLFPDVIKNAMTDNLALKKLVYLYVINYARANEELVILVINTFVKDADDPNPLIRALSIRTMALVRMEKVTEYLVGPLHKALRDKDPYVRKTAAVAVAKLFDSEPALVRDERFIPELQALLADGNPVVVSNAVASLSEIVDACGDRALLQLDDRSVPRYLAALGECTEWGQVFILDAIAGYSLRGGEEEARGIVERIIPRMQHANPAVVLAAVRVIVGLMGVLGGEERAFLVNKMRAPLITLLGAPPEMQYVVLRNVNLLLRAEPSFFDGHAPVFFAAYNDPLYVKVEKLDILVRLASAANARAIVSEFKEYASEVDLPFVRQAIAALGRIAVRLPSAAPAAVAVLVDLLATGRAASGTRAAEDVAVVLADVLRASPGEHTGAISALLDVSEAIVEPAARAALVWIVGEHAGAIDGAVEMVSVFLETLAEEAPAVQLQILTAAVKLFLTRGGDDCWALVQAAVAYATEVSDCADLRERAIVYARILSANMDAARAVVLAQKPGLKAGGEIEPRLLRELLGCLGSVAAVYREPVARFRGVLERTSGAHADGGMVDEEDLLGLERGAGGAGVPAIAAAPAGGSGAGRGAQGLPGIDDFLGGGGAGGGAAAAESSTVVAAKAGGGGGRSAHLPEDLFGPSRAAPPGGVASSGEYSVPTRSALFDRVLLPADKGKGLVVRGGACRRPDGSIAFDLEVENQGTEALSGFAFQLKRNAFGFVPAAPMSVRSPVAPGARARTVIPLGMSSDVDVEGGVRLHMALKFSTASVGAPTVVYCSEYIVQTLDVVLEAQQGRMDKADYLKLWAATPDAQEVATELHGTPGCDLTDAVAVIRRLEAGRVFLVAKRSVGGGAILYVSALVLGPLHCLIMAELTLPVSAGGGARLASRSPIGAVAAPFLRALGETCQRLLQ
jgi:vesicle coat complex subunit